MKLLALITDAFGSTGGIAQYNRDLLSALAALPDLKEIVVLPCMGLGSDTPQGLNQLPPVDNRFEYAWRALRLARTHRPDLIFCGHMGILPVAGVVSRWLNLPLWLQVHGIDAWERPAGLARRFITDVDFVTSVSRYTRTRVLAWSGLDRVRVKVLPNTVRSDFTPRDRERARAEFGLGQGPVMLTVARLASGERYKGHDLVIGCMPELIRRVPGVRYLVAGDGDDQERLRFLAKQVGVDHAVRFLGRVGDELLPDLYSAADLYVMPSSGEGFGIVFLEAMACGTPALGLGLDGSSDPLADGSLGVIAEEASLVDAIAANLSIARPERLSERVKQRFGTDVFREEVAQLLRSELQPLALRGR